jgi:transcriptional regulator with XRE-family HTH domain
MEQPITKQQLADWLVSKRGTKALVTFAKELGVSKTALINYEAGSRMPPTETFLRWSRQFYDFPGRNKVTNETVSRVEEPRAQYILGSQASYVAQALRRYDVDIAEHSVFSALLLDLYARQLVSTEAVDTLLDWYVRYHVGRAIGVAAATVAAG